MWEIMYIIANMNDNQSYEDSRYSSRVGKQFQICEKEIKECFLQKNENKNQLKNNFNYENLLYSVNNSNSNDNNINENENIFSGISHSNEISAENKKQKITKLNNSGHISWSSMQSFQPSFFYQLEKWNKSHFSKEERNTKSEQENLKENKDENKNILGKITCQITFIF